MEQKNGKFWWETISEEEGLAISKARAAGDRENAERMAKEEQQYRTAMKVKQKSTSATVKKKPAMKKK